MKKIFRNTMWIALGAIALTACSTDNTEELQPAGAENSDGGRTLTVVASLSDETKAAFNDGESIKWAVGDQIKWNGNTTQASDALDVGGTTATFKFTSFTPQPGTGWFHSTTTHPSNNNEVEFTLGDRAKASFTQDNAGAMNPSYLFLHSGTGTMQIPENAETISIKMEIAGSIFRVLPYTGTGKYADEQIEKVSLVSNSNLVGTVAYNHDAQTYRGVDDVKWQESKEVVVNLKEPFALTGVTSRETSKGIYMAVARTTTPLDGYKYVVYTDKATYTFDAMDKKLEVKDNVVKNIFLDLEKAKRIGNDEYKGELFYEQNVVEYNHIIFSHEAQTTLNRYGYYCVARVIDKGTTESVKREADVPGNEIFYDNVIFKATNADGSEATWVKCGFNVKSTHWKIDLEENKSGLERTATITATFADAGGYILQPGYKTLSITIRQEANVDIKATLSDIHTNTISKAGETVVAAKLALTVNGAAATDVKAAMDQYGVTATCGAAHATVDAAGNVSIAFPENKTANEKNYKLEIEYKNAAIADATYTQEKGDGTEVACPYTYEVEVTAALSWETNRGFAANITSADNYAFIRNIKLDGELVTLTKEIAAEVVAYAFRSTAPTEAEKESAGQPSKTASNSAVVAYVRWFGGTQIDVSIKTGESGGISKVTGYAPDGSELGYWMLWTD